MNGEREEAAVEQLLRIAALQQKFAGPDDELTQVVAPYMDSAGGGREHPRTYAQEVDESELLREGDREAEAFLEALEQTEAAVLAGAAGASAGVPETPETPEAPDASEVPAWLLEGLGAGTHGTAARSVAGSVPSVAVPDFSARANAGKPVAPHQLPAGTVLHGTYTVEGVLGQGGFGITYIGHDRALDTRVAVKEYYPNGYATRNTLFSLDVSPIDEKHRSFFEHGRQRFLEEARSLAKFSGLPGVVGVHAFFEENATGYIVMDYLEGTDLREYLNTSMPFAADDIFGRMGPVIDALEQVHARGVLHRDISPDNIMMLPDGSLRLMDFGAARLMDPDTERSISVMLKSGYAPQEQYLPKGAQGPWTDVYALCATIYKCITGVTPEDALQRAHEDEIRWPSELGFPITQQQEAALRRGMAVDHRDRLQSMGELRAALTDDGGADADTGASDTAPRGKKRDTQPFPAVQKAGEGAAAPATRTATAPAPAQADDGAAGIADARSSRGGRGGRKRTGIIAAVIAAVVLVVAGVLLATQLLAQPQLSATELVLVKGAEQTVSLERAEGDVEWRCDDKTVLKLSASGADVDVTAKSAGSARLMAVYDDKLYECRVTVEDPKLSTAKLTLAKGATDTLELKGTSLDVEWTSSDDKVVSIDVANGAKAAVTAKKAGKAKVTATVQGVKFTCTVTVEKPQAAGNTGGSDGSGGTGGWSSGGGPGNGGASGSTDGKTSGGSGGSSSAGGQGDAGDDTGGGSGDEGGDTGGGDSGGGDAGGGDSGGVEPVAAGPAGSEE